MIDEPLKEQASLYAAGALPADKAREFELVMRSNLELQLLVSECRHSLDALVMALPRRAPSPALKARLMRRVETRPKSAKGAAAAEPVPGGKAWAMLPWALAACLAFVCVVLLSRGRQERIQWVDMEQRFNEAVSQAQRSEKMLEAQKMEFQKQRQQISEMIVQQSADRQRQFATSSNQLVERIRVLESKPKDTTVRRNPTQGETAGNELAAAPAIPGGAPGLGGPIAVASPQTSFLGVLRSTQGGSPAAGAVSWDSLQQRGTILIEHLTPPAVDQDYQLWLFVDGAAISGGLLKYDAAGKIQFTYLAGAPIPKVDSFAISVEQKGGVESPQGPVILVSN
ncbi:MAG: anti-sigma factor [Verrucomicrobia bacterium]|nr:anti-sigma factor [Verrucomicrobiota bacterium]MBI3871145.1 anti-sigma factor [Verrucomicrobiota bacterium]